MGVCVVGWVGVWWWGGGGLPWGACLMRVPFSEIISKNTLPNLYTQLDGYLQESSIGVYKSKMFTNIQTLI